jgi:hypothetical protein
MSGLKPPNLSPGVELVAGGRTVRIICPSKDDLAFLRHEAAPRSRLLWLVDWIRKYKRHDWAKPHMPELRSMARRMRACIVARNWRGAEHEHQAAHTLLAQLSLAHATPLAMQGQKFSAGRKSGTGGPIRRAIAALLKKNPTMRPRELWATLSKRPPHGWTFCDNRLGRYIEGPKAQSMSYGRFSNVCKEERDKLA